MDQQNNVPQPPKVDDVRPPEPVTPQVSDEIVAGIQEPTRSADSGVFRAATAVDSESEVKQPPVDADAPQVGATEAAEASNTSAPTEHSSRRPPVMIVAALMAGLGLAGLSVFGYMNTNKADDAANLDASQTGVAAESSPATNIDETTQEIDSALESIDNESDFSEAELSDETLEL